MIGIDFREHNRREIEKHPMFKRIELVEGSSTDPAVLAQVEGHVSDQNQILIVLDSNHSHNHVLEKLQFSSRFVRKDSYLVVFDTVVEDLPADFFADRPWKPGNSPRTAVHQLLEENDHVRIDHEIQNKLLITVAPDGYLQCVKDKE